MRREKADRQSVGSTKVVTVWFGLVSRVVILPSPHGGVLSRGGGGGGGRMDGE